MSERGSEHEKNNGESSRVHVPRWNKAEPQCKGLQRAIKGGEKSQVFFDAELPEQRYCLA